MGRACAGLQPGCVVRGRDMAVPKDMRAEGVPSVMSRASVVIWLCVAVVLAGVSAMLLMPGSGSGTGRQRLMLFDPSQVDVLRIEAPGQSPQEVRRADAAWEIAWESDGGGVWRADESRVLSALRLLATLEGEITRSTSREARESPTISLIMDDGRAWTLTFGDAPLTGSVEVRVESPDGKAVTALASADVHAMLIRTGVLAWRDARLLAGLGADVSRLTLTTPSQRVSLGKVEGVWHVREPWESIADERAVAALVRRLASVGVSRFVTGSELATASRQCESPVATLIVESDIRELVNGEFRWAVLRREIVIGGVADLSERELFARAGGRDGREGVYVVVAREALDSIGMDPAMYASRVSIEVPGSEWGAIEVTLPSGHSARLERRLEGWTLADANGARPLDDVGKAAVQGLIALLSTNEAMMVRPAGAIDDHAMRIRITSLGGGEIALVSITANDGNATVVRRGVERVYDGGANVADAITAMVRPGS